MNLRQQRTNDSQHRRNTRSMLPRDNQARKRTKHEAALIRQGLSRIRHMESETRHELSKTRYEVTRTRFGETNTKQINEAKRDVMLMLLRFLTPNNKVISWQGIQ